MADEWAAAADAQEQNFKNLKINGAGDSVNEEEKADTATKAETSLLQKELRQTLVDIGSNTVKLEVQQKDPNSPLYSIKNFQDLHLPHDLLQGIWDMGFSHPSRIQETALPMLLANPPENMIAQSQSGTGKTAAFVLTMLHRVNIEKHAPQCICLLPTYELALQTGKTVVDMGKHLIAKGLSVAYAVKSNKVSRSSKIPSQIIIGTPGTMLEWCIKKRVVDMKQIKVFVLDEADVMIDTQGFKEMSIKLHKSLPTTCQVLLFSATYDDPVMDFAKRVVQKPNVIKLRRDEETLDNIKQYYVECKSPEMKYQALVSISSVLSVGQGIIFCRTKKMAKWLADEMLKDHYVVSMLTGDLDVVDRAEVLKRFKAGKEKWLVTTNVCSRGIDVEQVTLVINFDLPITHDTHTADCETYLHRIGRTGRFGKSGVAVNFISNSQDREILHQIKSHFKKDIIQLNDIEDDDELESKLVEN